MESTKVSNLIKEYLLPLRERNSKSNFFYRFVGYDQGFISFLGRYLCELKSSGIYIRETLQNPSDADVKFFEKTVGGFNYNIQGREDAVRKWFYELNATQQKIILKALEEGLLRMSELGLNENVLKNSFIKFLCWMKFNFKELLFRIPFVDTPKVLYEGTLGKYQIIFFKIIQNIGCDILTVDFSEHSSNEVKVPSYFNGEKIELPIKGVPPIHFTVTDWEGEAKAENFKEEMKKNQDVMNTNTWALWESETGVFENALKGTDLRGGKNHLYNVFCQIVGIWDKENYQNTLFQFIVDMQKQKKPYVISENKIPPISIDESDNFKIEKSNDKWNVIKLISDAFRFYNSEKLNIIGKGAIYKVLIERESNNSSQTYNLGVTLLCWLRRYGGELFAYEGKGQIPAFIYYGCCKNKNEVAFLDLLSALPVDVIVLCPDLEIKPELRNPKLMNLAYEKSMTALQYPSNENRAMAGTAAYQAERELDTLLYSDTGMYRTKQFKEATALNLKTTYDEIDILWDTEAKYRPYFQVNDEKVVVPNIFAKISGVENRNIHSYIEGIKKKINRNTIVIEGVPHLNSTDPNPIKAQVPKLIKNKKLIREDIKHHKDYQYDYLKEEVQEFILDKIEVLIEEDLIISKSGGIEYAIGAVLLNLDKNTVRIIQNFDFTGHIPKVIVVDTNETMCSLEDCIYIMFLSLVGFDVLIYSPPGYRVVDKYLKDNILKEHTIGEYVFDMELPRLTGQNVQSISEPRSFISKIFGRGRN